MSRPNSGRKRGTKNDMGMSVSGVYAHVVDDVMNNVKLDFYADGLDDRAIHEFRSLWEHNLVQTRAIPEPFPEVKPEASLQAKPEASLQAKPIRKPQISRKAKKEPYDDSIVLSPPWKWNPRTNAKELLVGPKVPASSSCKETAVKFEGPKPSPYARDNVHHECWVNTDCTGVTVNWVKTVGVTEEADYNQAELPMTALEAPPIPEDFLTISTSKRKLDEINSADCVAQREPMKDNESWDLSTGGPSRTR